MTVATFAFLIPKTTVIATMERRRIRRCPRIRLGQLRCIRASLTQSRTTLLSKISQPAAINSLGVNLTQGKFAMNLDAKHMRNPDYPYTMKLPDGRTVYVEVPGRWVRSDRGGEPAFMLEAVAFLDRVRALAMKLPSVPSPGFLVSLREGLGLTQKKFGEAVGVESMTVSRWERGTLHPSGPSLAANAKLRREAVRSGVVLPQ